MCACIMICRYKNFSRRGLWILVFAGILYLFCAPFPVFTMEGRREEGGIFLSELLIPSQPVITRYVHSVEKTAVEDEYYASHGRLWQWEERVRSHNAGLPFLKRPQSVFFQDSSWMHFRGGGVWYSSVYLRIGTEEFGKNQLELPGISSWNLYSLFPGEPVILQVRETSFLLACLESLLS